MAQIRINRGTVFLDICDLKLVSKPVENDNPCCGCVLSGIVLLPGDSAVSCLLNREFNSKQSFPVDDSGTILTYKKKPPFGHHVLQPHKGHKRFFSCSELGFLAGHRNIVFQYDPAFREDTDG